VSTGFNVSDAQSDFTRARRARLLADIARRLRGGPDDVSVAPDGDAEYLLVRLAYTS